MRTILLCLAFAAAMLSAQTIQVSGRVLTIDGKPLEGAQARLTVPGRNPTPIDAATNAQGIFTIENAPAGQYNFAVSKLGFLPYQTQLRESRTALEIRLTPASSITGRVTDADGNPVPKVQVTGYRYAYVRGARSLNTSNYSVATDADGVYTFPTLTAGRYYVRAEANGPSVITYYPSTLEPAAASAVDVETGATRSGIDIRRRKEPVFHIRGKAVDGSGAPAANAALTILAEQPIETQTPPPRVPTAEDGSFEFKDLLPGRYIIRAIPNGKVIVAGQPMDAKYAGRASVAIARDNIEDLRLTVNEGYNLAGKIKMEDASALPIPPAPTTPTPPGVLAMTGLRASLMDAEQTYTPGNLNVAAAPDSGAFRMDKIPPAKYYVRVNPLPANVYIKSVHYGGQDITRSPMDLMYGGGDNLEIVLGTKAATMNVTVRNSKGEVMPRIQVALWPDKPDLGTPTSSIRIVASDDNGVARFVSLRPEKYRLAAFVEAEAAFVRSPDFLDKFRARAVELDVSDGATLERTLEPISREDAAAMIRNLP